MNYKPTILIATHNRYEITKRLINKLFGDNSSIQIVIVVTDFNEYRQFKSLMLDNLHILKVPNHPLGTKWQFGVSHARKIGANPLIILGSDDELNSKFVSNAVKKIEEGYHFIGLRRYWIKHKGKKYLVDYKPVMPLGGGRVYSATLLDRMRWKVFESKDRKLDDYGWNQVVRIGARTILISDIEKAGMEITAIKGDWPMMNPFDPNHKNLTILKECAE
jgi:hypothetical protein